MVKAPDVKDEAGEVVAPGEISLDLTGRKPGRGAYLCRNAECLRAAREGKAPGTRVFLPDPRCGI